MTNDSTEQPDEATVPTEQQTTDPDGSLAVHDEGVATPEQLDHALTPERGEEVAVDGREPAGVIEDATDPDLPEGDDGAVTEPEDAPEEQPAPEHGAQDDGGDE